MLLRNATVDEATVQKIIKRGTREANVPAFAPALGPKRFEHALITLRSHRTLSAAAFVDTCNLVAATAASNPAWSARAQSEGAVALLAEAVRDRMGSALALQAALRALSECWWTGASDHASACEVVVAALQRHVADRGVAREACRALSELVRHPANARRALPTAAEALETALSNQPDDGAFVFSYTFAIDGFKHMDDGWRSLMDSDCLAALVAAAVARYDLPLLWTLTCFRLNEVSESEAARPRLEAMGARTLMLAALARDDVMCDVQYVGACLGLLACVRPRELSVKVVEEELQAVLPVVKSQQAAIAAHDEEASRTVLLGCLTISAAMQTAQHVADHLHRHTHSEASPLEGEELPQLTPLLGKVTVALLATMRAALPTSGLFECCCLALQPTLDTSASSRRLASRLGGVQLLLERLRVAAAASDAPARLCYSIGATLQLLVISPDTNTREAFVAAGAASAIARAYVDRLFSSPLTVAQCAASLTSIARSAAVAPALIDEGVDAAAVAALRAFPLSGTAGAADSEEREAILSMRHSIFDLLLTLAMQDSRCCLLRSDAGVVEEIIAAAANDGSDAVAATRAAKVVTIAAEANYSSMQAAKASSSGGRPSAAGRVDLGLFVPSDCLLRCGAPAVLVSALSRLRGDSDASAGARVVWRLCRALRALAIFPAARTALMAAGAGAELIEVLRGSAASHSTATWPALGALFGLACNATSCSELLALGAAEAAVNALRIKKDDWRICWAGCGVLLRLASAAAAAASADGDDSRLFELVRREGAGEALMGAVLAHGAEHERVAKAAAAALKLLAKAPENGEVLTALLQASGLSGDLRALIELR